MIRKHPYIGLPAQQFWKRAASGEMGERVDPVSDVPFQISRSDKIVTAGSCFAQHVARYMTDAGYNHFIAERAHPMIPDALARKHNYGLFSARYGNLYTARQLLQLLHRAYGLCDPVETFWPTAKPDVFVDPFRPQIQPGGYPNEAELIADRDQHLAAVRKAVEELDIFVFTLGLTEAWVDTRDGAVFPLAPGVAGGVYDPERVTFHNFDETETADDLAEALAFIREKNPTARFIVTVSPVPLNATFEGRHVWTSTTWSKAALRIAAERVTRAMNDCCYFPSYEIITSPHVRGRYYANDGREVLEPGVNHVMSLFARHFFKDGEEGPAQAEPAEDEASRKHLQEMEDLIEVLCDEAAIDNE